MVLTFLLGTPLSLESSEQDGYCQTLRPFYTEWKGYFINWAGLSSTRSELHFPCSLWQETGQYKVYIFSRQMFWSLFSDCENIFMDYVVLDMD